MECATLHSSILCSAHIGSTGLWLNIGDQGVPGLVLQRQAHLFYTYLEGLGGRLFTISGSYRLHFKSDDHLPTARVDRAGPGEDEQEHAWLSHLHGGLCRRGARLCIPGMYRLSKPAESTCNLSKLSLVVSELYTIDLSLWFSFGIRFIVTRD